MHRNDAIRSNGSRLHNLPQRDVAPVLTIKSRNLQSIGMDLVNESSDSLV